jgi:hypothetical protein
MVSVYMLEFNMMRIAIIALISAFSAPTSYAQQIVGNFNSNATTVTGHVTYDLLNHSMSFAPHGPSFFSADMGPITTDSSDKPYTLSVDFDWVGVLAFDSANNDYSYNSSFENLDPSGASVTTRGMAFDDNDTLYLLKSRPYSGWWWGPPTAELYTVDTTPGYHDYFPNLIGALPLILNNDAEVTSLAFHDDRFYTYLSPGGLVAINPNNAHSYLLTPNMQNAAQLIPGKVLVRGLCISDSGVFYASFQPTSRTNHHDYFPYIVIIDPETGALSYINEYVPNYFAATGLAFVEGADAPLALWAGGTTGNTPLGPLRIKGSGVAPGDQVAVYYTLDLTAAPAIIPTGMPGAGTQLNIGGTLLYLGTATANADGQYRLPTGGVSERFRNKILFQGVNLTNSKTTNFFRVIM